MNSMGSAVALISDELTEDVKRRSYQRMFLTLLLITVSVLAFTALFELLVEYVHTDETIRESHLTTILFSSLVAAAASFFGLRKYESLVCKTEKAVERKREAETALRHTVAELQSLQSITNELLELDDPSQVMDTIAKGIVNHLGYQTALVGKYSRETGTISAVAVFPRTGTAEKFLEGFTLLDQSGGRPLTGEVDPWISEILSGKGVTSIHPKNLFLSLASEMKVTVDENAWHCPAFIGTALQIKGETAGIILAGGSEELVFRSSDCLARVANHAAIAMENARLFSHVCGQSEDLRQLRIRLEKAEETERRRLASELHDQVGQNLTAIGINLNIIGSRLLNPDKDAQLSDSYKLLDDTMDRIRGVMAELRPPGLGEYGLEYAIRRFCRLFLKRTGMEVTLNVGELKPRPSPTVERVFFRIAQEALANIARHSGAHNVSLVLDKSARRLQMQIIDDGCGFDPDKVDAENNPKWGLKIMKERAEMAGGTLRVDSKPGGGTRIIVEKVDGDETDDSFPCR